MSWSTARVILRQTLTIAICNSHRGDSRIETCLKEIGKEIYLNIFESIQGVVMNAHKNTTQ